MEGVVNLYPQTGKQGVAELKKFTITKEGAQNYNLSRLFSGQSIMYVCPGDFVSLAVNGELMMSDTQMERNTNEQVVREAKGDVMIAGLGIGLIIHNIRDKVASGEVTSITVYEKYQDVIDLVAPHFADIPNLRIVCQDILEYHPPKEEKYDTMYFDIWATIDYDKNLPEIRMLHNRWKSHKKTKESFMNSWVKEYMQRQKAADNRERYW